MSRDSMNHVIKNWQDLSDGPLSKSGDSLISAGNLDASGAVDTGETFGEAAVLRQTFSGTRTPDSSVTVTQELLAAAAGVTDVVSVKGSLTLAGGNKVSVQGAFNDDTDHQEATIQVTAAGAMNLVATGSPAVATYELAGWDIIVDYTVS